MAAERPIAEDLILSLRLLWWPMDSILDALNEHYKLPAEDGGKWTADQVAQVVQREGK